MRRALRHACLWPAALSALSGCRREPPVLARDSAGAITTSVKLDNFGYRPDDTKVAVFSVDPGGTVEVRTAGNVVALTVTADGGSISSKGLDAPSGDRVWWADFSPLKAPGSYHLTSVSLQGRSYTFTVSPDVYRDVLRAALKTFYRQRCGQAKPPAFAGAWSDGTACHRADASTGPARGEPDHGRRDLAGGWHDAGDYNKYLWYATSNALLYLLRAWEEDPGAFPDGDLDIPESGNGLSDLLDEVKWELDFLLRMQLADGSVLSRVHAEASASGAAPPSLDRSPRYYQGPTLESGAVFAGSCALGARVFAAAGQAAYAATLNKAALAAWDWLRVRGDSDEKAWAAAEVFRMDPDIESARRYVDSYHPGHWAGATLRSARYDTHAALAYLGAPGATPEVAAEMRAGLGREVDRIFAADDLYRSGLPATSYHWGSNAVRGAQGRLLLDAGRLGATGSHPAQQCRLHALDILHFFHGQNPLSMVYLTNMAAYGGEHSSWQFFHHWFGQSQSAYSRAKYIGKPASAPEPDYPYFAEADNHGIRDDKRSAFGPPPGFLTGGPNAAYSGDARPPSGTAAPNRSYRDWNDQTVWTARSWEITESSIGYQGPYVALVAAFAGGK